MLRSIVFGLKRWLRGSAFRDPHYISHHGLRTELATSAPHAGGRLLDMGCGSKPYQPIFAPYVSRHVGIELPGNAGNTVDAFADALRLPFGDASFDVVLCTEVVEHVPEPRVVLGEAHRVLRPGGLLFLTAPQTWGLHHQPHDFYRYTCYGLRYLVEGAGFEVCSIAPTSGLWGTLTQRLVDSWYVSGLAEWRQPARDLAYALCGLGQVGALRLDQLSSRRDDPLDYVMLARKSEPAADGPGTGAKAGHG